MITLRKSVVKDYLTTLNKHRLEYFKRELIKVLDEQERNEPPEVSKALLIDEMLKSMTDLLCIAKGGKVGIVGEIRTWNGKKYKKMPNKKWVRVYDTHDKHTEISIARLKGKIRKAQSVDELFEIVMNNTHRFSDKNGKLLDIVLELKKEVNTRKRTLNAGGGGNGGDDGGNNGKIFKFSSLTDKEKSEMGKKIQSSVVSEIGKDTIPTKEGESFSKTARNWIKNNPQGNADTFIGEVVINEKSAEKDLYHGDVNDLYLKLQTLPSVKDVLEKGTYLGYEKDFDGKPMDNHYFAGKIKYGDEEKIVFCRVRENKGDKNRFYVHEVFTEDEIKKEVSMRSSNDSSQRLTGKPLYSFILQQVLNVNEKVKKLNPADFGVTQEKLDKYNVKLVDSVGNWAVFEQDGEYGYIHNGKAVRQWHKTADEVKDLIKQKAEEEQNKIIESERVEKEAIAQLGEEKYNSLLDYAAKFYDNLAKKTGNTYGMSRIKEVVLGAIDKINKKDWEFLELVRRAENKISRKVFETVTGIDLGTNEKAGTAAWEKWCGKENVAAHKKMEQDKKDAEKAKVEAEKKAAFEVDHKEYNGFLDDKTATYKGKAKQILDKKYRYDGKVMSFQELADSYIKNGGHVVKRENYQKTKAYYYVSDSQGRGYEVPKIVYDYAKHIQDNGTVEKSLSSRMNEILKSFYNQYGVVNDQS